MPVDIVSDWRFRMEPQARAAFVRGWNDVACRRRFPPRARGAWLIDEQWEALHYEAGRLCALGYELAERCAPPPIATHLPLGGTPPEIVRTGFNGAVNEGAFTLGWLRRG